jgi:undecaprenyl-diphosphatase
MSLPDLAGLSAALPPLGLSLAAIALGWLWAIQPIDQLDRRAAAATHAARLPHWVDTLAASLRPLGRSYVQWILILLAIVASWRAGLALAAAMVVCLGVERGVKLAARRPRPFVDRPEMRPPPSLTPTDASFPSGDSVRVWMLASFLAAQPACPGWLAAAGFGAACVVSFGRVRLGVHTPLDVLAGAGLGAGLGLAGAIVAGLVR